MFPEAVLMPSKSDLNHVYTQTLLGVSWAAPLAYRVCVCSRACLHGFVVCVCPCVRVCARVCVRAHVCVSVCVFASVCLCVFVCGVCMCMKVCVVCVSIHACVCVRACRRAGAHACLNINKWKCVLKLRSPLSKCVLLMVANPYINIIKTCI
jgi:hypothetical protein